MSKPAPARGAHPSTPTFRPASADRLHSFLLNGRSRRRANEDLHDVAGQAAGVNIIHIDEHHHPGPLVGNKHDEGAGPLLAATMTHISEPRRVASTPT